LAHPQPKKQHYVPQFILKEFSVGKKKRIYTFDKKRGKSFPSHVGNSGHENNFYHHTVHGNSMEFRLGELETILAPIIKTIIKCGTVKRLSDEDHQRICFFVAVQMSRVNSVRESMSQGLRILAEKLKDDVIAPNSSAEKLLATTEDDIKESSIDMLNNIPDSIYPHIFDKSMSLVKAPKGESFYISDNPIVKYNHIPESMGGNLGLCTKGIEIYFPISSKYCLSFLCPDFIKDVRNKAQQNNALFYSTVSTEQANLTELLEQYDSKITKQLLSEHLKFYNSIQVLNSSRFIYSNSPEFLLANVMLTNNPEILKQPRVVNGAAAF
jgi:hypothetical protein